MRDPAASLAIEGDKVLRRLVDQRLEGDFLGSQLSHDLTERRQLVSFELLDAKTVASPLLPFVTYPYEWSDIQLYRAARLTLAIQQACVEHGYELKDASAWNVIYSGTNPIFCDLLSFERICLRKWWAMGQFTRHFLLPLVVAKHRGLRTHEAFKAWRDGIPPTVAKTLLGKSRYLSRYWTLVVGETARRKDGNLGVPSMKSPSCAYSPSDPATPKAWKAFRSRLHTSIDWMLAGIAPPGERTADGGTGWATYTADRPHYVGSSIDLKRATVSMWMERLRPDWVADFGCNTGDFSEIALALGSHVVALDADHDCIRKLFLRFEGSERIYPVLADLDDLSGGRGWAGAEHPGLLQRLETRFDLVMALAIIHHLAIAAAVPLASVAHLLHRCTRRWLIVELIDQTDPQLRLLCLQRKREPAVFSKQRQLDAFLASGFIVEDTVSLDPAARSLALLRRQ